MKAQLYDYSKLRGRIVEKYSTITAFAEVLGVSFSVISMRLHNKAYWPQPDIDKACELLDIADPMEYFFVRVVKNDFTNEAMA